MGSDTPSENNAEGNSGCNVYVNRYATVAMSAAETAAGVAALELGRAQGPDLTESDGEDGLASGGWSSGGR